MPAYTSLPGAKIGLLTSGLPAYCFGGFADNVSPTRMTVSNVALTTNVATLTVQVIEGNIPAVGSLVTVTGTQSTSGLFNVSQVALTGVTIDATSGAGTITFALTHANVGTAPNSGLAVVQTPETSEAIANGSSVAWSAPFQPSQLNQGRSIKAVVSFPTIPTTGTVTLQEAIVNQDSEFSGIATVASVAGGVVTGGTADVTGTPGRFYRLNYASLAGSGLIIGKLLA